MLLARYRAQLGPLAAGGVLLTLVLLGMSATIDFVYNDIDQIVEDGFKFVGICAWATTWTLRTHPWTLRHQSGPGRTWLR